jgi:hypothetical protein
MPLRTLIVFISLMFATSANAEAHLVMVEEAGCVWCERWNDEISHIYPKTTEGKAAPLVRMDIHAPLPDNIEFASSLHFTPTFVLVVDGKETSRIEGYPGEDFFWGLLGRMLSDADIPKTGS